MQTSRNTRLAFSALFSTSGMRFRATCMPKEGPSSWVAAPDSPTYLYTQSEEQLLLPCADCVPHPSFACNQGETVSSHCKRMVLGEVASTLIHL
jgi:hypothetical protein